MDNNETTVTVDNNETMVTVDEIITQTNHSFDWPSCNLAKLQK